ncbi:MAG: hypothetical protein HC880_13780 [Bacteroidia bacterium]|nr:hypothetical protein [Bacteroidia bacterium]
MIKPFSSLFLNRLIVSFAILLSLYACNDDKENPNPNTDPQDANAVSQALSISNATAKNGNAPAPTGDAPTIQNLGSSSIPVRPGQTAYLGIGFSDAENAVSGYYLQVKGASQYFEGEFPEATVIKSGSKGAGLVAKNLSGKQLPDFSLMPSKRLKDGDDEGVVTIPITVGNNVSFGTFCVLVCLVDSEGNISNIIERCVEVNSIGTQDTELLGSDTPWNLTKVISKDLFSNEEEEVVIGQLYNEDEECFSFAFRIDHFRFTFQKDGLFGFDLKQFVKIESDCSEEEPIGLEYSFDEEAAGYWAYEGADKTLTVYVLDYYIEDPSEGDDDDGEGDDDDEGSENLGEFVVFKVSKLTENELVIFTEEDDYRETYYFTKN